MTGDMKPYALRTRDYGKTWESLLTATPPEVNGYLWKLIEDTENKDLLFLGSEFGLYLSIDGGKQWARFTGGLPESEKNRQLRQAHLLLHASMREGWGLNVIEAK